MGWEHVNWMCAEPIVVVPKMANKWFSGEYLIQDIHLNCLRAEVYVGESYVPGR